MKKNILSIVILFTLTTQAFTHVEHYKDFNLLKFELFRNNKLIGYHNYKFEKKNDILDITSIVEFKITKLGVDLYKYDAVSKEKYKS